LMTAGGGSFTRGPTRFVQMMDAPCAGRPALDTVELQSPCRVTRRKKKSVRGSGPAVDARDCAAPVWIVRKQLWITCSNNPHPGPRGMDRNRAQPICVVPGVVNGRPTRGFPFPKSLKKCFRVLEGATIGLRGWVARTPSSWERDGGSRVLSARTAQRRRKGVLSRKKVLLEKGETAKLDIGLGCRQTEGWSPYDPLTRTEHPTPSLRTSFLRRSDPQIACAQKRDFRAPSSGPRKFGAGLFTSGDMRTPDPEPRRGSMLRCASDNGGAYVPKALTLRGSKSARAHAVPRFLRPGKFRGRTSGQGPPVAFHREAVT